MPTNCSNKLIRLVIATKLLLFISFNSFAQDSKTIQGLWNGGIAFEGEYSDSLLIFNFTDDKFILNYGPNYFNEFTNFSLNGDTLIIKQNHDFQEATFRILTLNDSILEIQAMNSTAIFLINVICSPYNDAEWPKISKSESFSIEAVLKEDILNTHLNFIRL